MTGLVDATRLGLVHVPQCGCSLHSAQGIPRRQSPFIGPTVQAHVEYDLLDDAIIRYAAHYRPGGPMGPMSESPYRDWPPR